MTRWSSAASSGSGWAVRTMTLIYSGRSVLRHLLYRRAQAYTLQRLAGSSGLRQPLQAHHHHDQQQHHLTWQWNGFYQALLFAVTIVLYWETVDLILRGLLHQVSPFLSFQAGGHHDLTPG